MNQKGPIANSGPTRAQKFQLNKFKLLGKPRHRGLPYKVRTTQVLKGSKDFALQLIPCLTLCLLRGCVRLPGLIVVAYRSGRLTLNSKT